jgi:exopolysaccharide biosynthesis polyprenyl glycosylphosphotransferase
MRFLQLIPVTIWALLACDAVLVVTVYLLATMSLSPMDAWVWLEHGGGFLRVLLMSGAIILGFYMVDLYTKVRVRSAFMLFQQFCLVVGVGFLFQAMLSYLMPSLMLPRWIMMSGSLSLLVVMPLWRVAFSRALQSARADEHLLLVGLNTMVEQLVRELGERPERGLVVIGYIDNQRREESDLPWLGRLAEMREIVGRVKPDRIVVGLEDRRGELPIEDLLYLSYHGHRIEPAEATFEAIHGRVCSERLRPSQFIFTTELLPPPFVVGLQRIYSLLLALGGVILLAPIMVVVAVLVKATSPGPVLYRQTRVGRHGAPFTIIKFRSMRADAERTTGAKWATRGDPRVTPLGGWLRKFRLDELPQLFNVVKGEMSIVGPRPERPEFVEQLSAKIPFYQQRLAVKPGITGWAQINYGYGETIEDTIKKLEYDLYYIKNLSFGLDFYIMFHTLKVMLLARGSQ